MPNQEHERPTLGQRLKSYSPAIVSDTSSESVARHLEVLRQREVLYASMRSVFAQAKVDIEAAIEARKPAHEVCSRVFDTDPVYDYLHRLHGQRLRFDWECRELQTQWRQFQAWCQTQELQIELRSILPPIVDGVQQKHAAMEIAVVNVC